MALLFALFGADLALGPAVLLAPLYGASALVAALGAGLRATVAVSALAGVLCLVALADQTGFDNEQDAVRVLTVGVTGTLAALAARLRERLVAEEARQRVLARSAEVAVSSSDVRSRLDRLAALAVPAFADWCAIDLVQPDRTIAREALNQADPMVGEAVRDLRAQHAMRLDDASGPGLVVRTGRPQVTLDVKRVGSPDPDERRAFEQLDVRSRIIAPLQARDRTLGAISFVRSRRQRFTDADVRTATELATRCAQAIDQARLVDEMRDTQRRLLEAFGLLDVLFERAPIGLAFFDRDLRYLRINGFLAGIDGVPAADHLGRRVPEILPDLDPAVEDDLRRVLADGRPIVDTEVHGKTPARPGDPRDFLVSYFPVRRGGAEIIGLGMLVQDITERRSADRALRAQTDRYETLLLALSEAGEGMVVLEDEHVAYANQAFQTMSGYGFEELRLLESVFELVVSEDRDEARSRAAARVDQGIVDPHYALRLRRRDGRVLDLEVAGVPLDIEGRRQLVVVVRDVTARRRAEAERERLFEAERAARAEAEAGRRRARFLAEASAAFEQSLDLQRTAELTARLPLGADARTAVVVLTAPGDVPDAVAIAARDAGQEAGLRELFERYPVRDRSTDHPIRMSARLGRTLRVGAMDAARIAALAADDEHAALLRRLDLPDQLVVPLRARERILGAVTFGVDAPLDDPAGEETVALLEEFCARAALALDNARLYEERSHVARTLQRSLLPSDLPEIPGTELAAKYLPAGEGNEVGGDFYDGFALGGDEWALVIGDVCGKGAEAAAITALARYTTRATVLHTRRPSRVLGELNEALLRQDLDFRFCTVAFAAIRPLRSGSYAVRLAAGGHPLPLIVRASGATEYAGSPGTLLGVVPDPQLPESEVVLAPGDAIVLYTDGVIEASPVDDALGPDALAAFAGRLRGATAAGLADAIEGAVLALQDGDLRDDVAILVLRVSPPA